MSDLGIDTDSVDNYAVCSECGAEWVYSQHDAPCEHLAAAEQRAYGP